MVEMDSLIITRAGLWVRRELPRDFCGVSVLRIPPELTENRFLKGKFLWIEGGGIISLKQHIRSPKSNDRFNGEVSMGKLFGVVFVR